MRRYVISIKPRNWGALVEVVASTERGKAPAAGTRCFSVYAGKAEPCEFCPARTPEFERGPSTTVVPSDGDPINIATARRLPRDTAEITVRSLDSAEVSAVIHEKLARVAQAAQLSARERMVLDLLLRGHRNDEIAEELAISARTAKFHQANILKKLGLDSRADLIRLLV